MSLLSLVQGVMEELKLPAPVSVVNSQDGNVKQMLQLLKSDIKALESRYKWQGLTKEFIITLVDGQDLYSLPPDLRRWIFGTGYNRSDTWRLYGPLTPQEYQERVSGAWDAVTRTEYRILNNKIKIRPIPDSGTAGQIVVIEYQSKQAYLPKEWSTEETISTGVYRSYDGRVYKSASPTGLTGSTPPTHTTGTVTDGGISWLFIPRYDVFYQDDDEFVLDEHLHHLGLIWRWCRANGREYAAFLEEQKRFYFDIAGAIKGARVLDLACSSGPLIVDGTYPETEVGQ